MSAGQLAKSEDRPVAQVGASLIVSTLGRVQPLEALFDSLTDQEFKDFEVIVVDQNDDDRLAPVLDQNRWPFPVRRVHTPGQPGNTIGRNKGLKHAQGDIVLFPDDDCWYPPWFLSKGIALLKQHQCASVSGRAADQTGRSINARFQTRAERVNRRNVWTTQIEWVVFYLREALVAVDGYDQSIGIGCGTPWTAYEGPDLTLRLLEAGYSSYYDPDLYGFHPELATARPDESMIRKCRTYARGFGYVLRRHGYGPLVLSYWMSRAAAGAVLSLAKGNLPRSRYYANVVVGRLEGWLNKLISREH